MRPEWCYAVLCGAWAVCVNIEAECCENFDFDVHRQSRTWNAHTTLMTSRCTRNRGRGGTHAAGVPFPPAGRPPAPPPPPPHAAVPSAAHSPCRRRTRRYPLACPRQPPGARIHAAVRPLALAASQRQVSGSLRLHHSAPRPLATVAACLGCCSSWPRRWRLSLQQLLQLGGRQRARPVLQLLLQCEELLAVPAHPQRTGSGPFSAEVGERGLAVRGQAWCNAAARTHKQGRGQHWQNTEQESNLHNEAELTC